MEDDKFTQTHWCVVGKFSISQSTHSNEYFVDSPPRELTHVIKSIQEKYDYPITNWNDILLDVNVPYVDRTGSNQLIITNNIPESDICNSSVMAKLEGPISWIVLEYKSGTNIAFKANFSNEEFEEYLKGIDYKNSERATNYVNSLISEIIIDTTFYSDRNLIPEEEKLMIQISEKYLEFFYDGKKGFVEDVNTLYTDKKNEINAIPMQDSRLTICGDDKITGLEDFEEIKVSTQYIISHNISDVIEDWEKNLKLKQSKFPADFPKEESIIAKNVEITGEIGLKKGDWVKYKMDVDGDGLFGIVDILKKTSELPDIDCTVSEIDWHKFEIIEMNNNYPTVKSSTFCNGEEHENPTAKDSFTFIQYFIPIDVKVGDVFTSFDSEYEVLGFETKFFDGKNTEVIRLYSEEIKLYENDGKMKTTDELFFEKNSGILLEKSMSMEATNVPFLGDMSMSVTFDAIDYSTPRSILSQSSGDSGGGCLIATATYGSELAPQVQQLRELRDNSLLQTESGTNFMNAFNDFYYSFSPVIADYERENPVFREAIKLTLTPLISSLSLLNYVDMDSESTVLGYGISLIVLNVMMYFGIPIFAIMKIRK